MRQGYGQGEAAEDGQGNMSMRAERRAKRVRPVRRRRGWARALIRATGVLVFTALVVFVAGFALFLSQIETDTPDDSVTADAIVVLTGGDSRVAEAVRLLSAGNGRRLLISGVHPQTTVDMLRRLNPEAGDLFDCCIDLDRNARDTIENANETRRWLVQRGFRSVIVVTSSYHMPRGLVELRRAVPEVQLVAYPVVPSRLRLDEWWIHPDTLRIVASEFVKYLASLGRCVGVRLMASSMVGDGVLGCLDPVAV